MNEPKVTAVLPGFWALNKEEQAQMIAKLEKMKAESDSKNQPKQNDHNPYNLTAEQLENSRRCRGADKNGTLIIEGREAMSELVDQIADGEEL